MPQITNREIYNKVDSIDKHLERLNGSVAKQETRIRSLEDWKISEDTTHKQKVTTHYLWGVVVLLVGIIGYLIKAIS